MNGASAEPAVRTIRIPSSALRTMMGASHHFFRTFRKAQNSLQNCTFSFTDSLMLMISFQPPRLIRREPIAGPAGTGLGSIELELLPPILVFLEAGLILLVQ